MSDEASLEQGQADDTQQQHDWEKDYKELQATYTQSQQALKEAQGVWDDEDALIARIREQHPHLVHEDDEPEEEPTYETDDEPDPYEQRITAIERVEQERQQREAQTQLSNHWAGWEEYVKEQAAEQGVELKSRDIKALRADCVGRDGYPIPPDKAAALLGGYVTEYFAEPETPKKKRPPTVAPGGKAAADEVVDWDSMSRSEQAAHMADRARALEAQTQ